MCSIFPWMCISGAIMSKYAFKYAQYVQRPEIFKNANSFNLSLSLEQVAEGGTLAEEVISTIRTAQAFGTQNVLASLYDVTVQKAYDVDCRLAIAHGIGFSCLFFAIYASYGLGESMISFLSNHKLIRLYPAFSFGATLINQGKADPGQIVIVIMAILIGSLSLAMMAPDVQGTNQIPIKILSGRPDCVYSSLS